MILLLGVLVLALLLGAGAAWLLASRAGARYVAGWLRQQMGQNSHLVLGPLQVHLTPWRDFPHLTASVQHLALTDTANGQAVPVLRVGRVDLRLRWAVLWNRQLRVSRISVYDATLVEEVDSLGRRWGLQPRRRKPAGRVPAEVLAVDSLRLFNVRISTRNAYRHSALTAVVRRGSLAAGLRGGTLRVHGSLNGELQELRNPGGTLFRNEPLRAGLHYGYDFARRQGRFYHTYFTLHGDTVLLNGTHTVPADRPTGTLLNLQFAGNQPLLDVLNTVLPPRLKPALAGASSPSKARIRYTLTGISGPTDRPRTVLQFGLTGAQVRWPDSARRINHWDLAGTYDNGPGHRPETTTLQLRQCRIATSAGQLDVRLLLRNFRRPYVDAQVQGRTTLPELAAVLAPDLWRGRAGTAALNLRMRGQVPAYTPGANGPDRLLRTAVEREMDVRGQVRLRGASFVLRRRGASVQNLNVDIGLRDSSWRLNNASGVLAGMRFTASATTTYLLAYLTGQHPSTSISGRVAVEELHLDRLRSLLQPIARSGDTGRFPRSARGRRARGRAARVAAARTARMTATLGNDIIPAAVRLDVALRCGRLVLADDTVRDLAVRVQHNAHRMQLSRVRARLWGGRVTGEAGWPTDRAQAVAPVAFRLAVRFGTVDYRQFLAHLRRPAPAAAAPKRPGGRAALPALRDLLLAANGHLDCRIDTVRLPDPDDKLRHLRFELVKDETALRLPYLRFGTQGGGTGDVAAAARLNGMHFSDASATLNLYYPVLDVQELLRLLVLLTPPRRAPTPAQLEARDERRLKRADPDFGTLLSNGKLEALVRVQADEVRYAALSGRKFRLVAQLDDGAARLDECAFAAFGGQVRLRGALLTPDDDPNRHTLRTQLQLLNVDLPALFAATTAMNLKGLRPENVRGTLRCAADLHTDFGKDYAPALERTEGYLRAEIDDLELLNVDALESALGFLKKERTGHLYFEPVQAVFGLQGGELLIPDLRLNSNLSQLALGGRYGLDGRADLYVGLKPLQTLFGNNDKRVERIQRDEPVNRRAGHLTYLSLRRATPGDKYVVRLLRPRDLRQVQAGLRQQAEHLIKTQRLDTTLQLLR